MSLPAGRSGGGGPRSRSLCRPPDHPFLVLDLARRPLPLLLTLLEARSWTRSSGPEPKHLGSQAGHPSAPCSPGRQTCPRQAPVGPVLGSELSPESPRLWISSEVPIPPPRVCVCSASAFLFCAHTDPPCSQGGGRAWGRGGGTSHPWHARPPASRPVLGPAAPAPCPPPGCPVAGRPRSPQSIRTREEGQDSVPRRLLRGRGLRQSVRGRPTAL